MDILELKTDAVGVPVLETGDVTFRTAQQGLSDPNAGMSDYEACKGYVFVEFQPGFSSNERIADRDRLMVMLSGGLRVSADDETFKDLGPGDVARLEMGDMSEHRFEVLGDEPARILVAYA